jgi:hypothetical protein
MNLELTKVINAIESEIGLEYLGGAIAWADSKYNNKWSDSMARFETALNTYLQNRNENYIKSETYLYKQNCLDMLREYKREKKLDDTRSFLDSIKR